MSPDPIPDASLGGDADTGCDVVREALRALAVGDTPVGDDSRTPAAVVAEAEAALSTLGQAAAFADAGGFDRLRRLIAWRATTAAESEVVERGEEVLDSLARYRTAFAGAGDAGTTTDRAADRTNHSNNAADRTNHTHSAADRPVQTDPTANRDAARPASDHFHSAHDSHIPRGALREDN